MGQPSSTHDMSTDWTKCLFCQEDTAEVLRCPLESKRSDQGSGYTTIADLLLGFSEIGCLPPSLNLLRLDEEGNGISALLNQHKAKWHDSCRLKYNRTQLRRAEKKKRPIEDLDMVDVPVSLPPPKITRQNLKQVGPSKSCFFCGKPASSNETFRLAATFELDEKVRKCAAQLQDHQLLAKLSAGDLIA